MKMKKVLISTLATALAMSFAVPANAAKHKVSDSLEASCKAQAAKKYSAIHFIKRRQYVQTCMGERANAKSKPTTTGQTSK
jgi:hypothetical protein